MYIQLHYDKIQNPFIDKCWSISTGSKFRLEANFDVLLCQKITLDKYKGNT